MHVSELYSLPLLPLGLRRVVQLMCLMGQDDIPVIHRPSSPANEWNCWVIVVINEGQGALAIVILITASSTREGHFTVLLHLDIIHSMIVRGVGAHTAPTDWRRATAQWPVEALRRRGAGRSLRPHHRAAMVLIERGQHEAGGEVEK